MPVATYMAGDSKHELLNEDVAEQPPATKLNSCTTDLSIICFSCYFPLEWLTKVVSPTEATSTDEVHSSNLSVHYFCQSLTSLCASDA